MENIQVKISEDLIRKIIGNKEYAEQYLLSFNAVKPIPQLKTRTLTRGQHVGRTVLDMDTKDIWKTIVTTWDYEVSRTIIRDLFQKTDKYKNGKDADDAMNILMQEWRALRLGDISWPFSQGLFDGFVQRINAEKGTGTVKDNKVKNAAVKYRRIKEINTVRNDFIETLIFEKNENILPTLSHRRGVDFFIDGISFDQKVAKSPTDEFKKYFKERWRDVAIQQPEVVAEYLYKYQGEERFGADPRLLIVYIDEDVSIDKIREIIDKTNLKDPAEINFTYSHKLSGDQNYKVSCFIILLHN